MNQPPPVLRSKPPFWSRDRKIAFIFALLLFSGFFVVGRLVADAREEARLASCRPTVMFSALKGYALNNEGIYPPLSPIPGRFVFDTEKVEGFGSTYDYMCGFDPSERYSEEVHDVDFWRLDDWSYVYLGYVIENEEEGLAFLNAYADRIKSKGDFEADLPVTAGQGNNGTALLHRLRKPETFTGDLEYLQSRAHLIPVVIEWPGDFHKGSKVVFLDGHTEVIPYPGKFPMTEKFITALRATDLKYGPYMP